MSRQIVSIVMAIACLIAIIVLKQRCGAATAQLFQAVSQVTDGGAHD
jgi:hypothetical protein